MATIRKFEDMEAWQSARALAQEIYSVRRHGAFNRDFALRDQIRRAAISVGSNIAEGSERSRRREFLHFLSIAKGSAGEVRSQLYIALDQAYIDQDSFERIYLLTGQTLHQIGGLMRYLESCGPHEC